MKKTKKFIVDVFDRLKAVLKAVLKVLGTVSVAALGLWIIWWIVKSTYNNTVRYTGSSVWGWVGAAFVFLLLVGLALGDSLEEGEDGGVYLEGAEGMDADGADG